MLGWFPLCVHLCYPSRRGSTPVIAQCLWAWQGHRAPACFWTDITETKRHRHMKGEIERKTKEEETSRRGAKCIWFVLKLLREETNNRTTELVWVINTNKDQRERHEMTSGVSSVWLQHHVVMVTRRTPRLTLQMYILSYFRPVYVYTDTGGKSPCKHRIYF